MDTFTYTLTRKDLQGLADKAAAAKLERELTSFSQVVRNSVLRAAKDGYYQIIQMIPEGLHGHRNALCEKLRQTFPDSEIRVDSTMIFISWD